MLQPQLSIDITDQICPMTFVRTQLAIEKIAPGEILAVRLKGVEPLLNVPRSATDRGHQVIKVVREPYEKEDGIHVLWLRKAD